MSDTTVITQYMLTGECPKKCSTRSCLWFSFKVRVVFKEWDTARSALSWVVQKSKPDHLYFPKLPCSTDKDNLEKPRGGRRSCVVNARREVSKARHLPALMLPPTSLDISFLEPHKPSLDSQRNLDIVLCNN